MTVDTSVVTVSRLISHINIIVKKKIFIAVDPRCEVSKINRIELDEEYRSADEAFKA